MELAYRRMRAMFEFLDKLGVEYWCFHDRSAKPSQFGGWLSFPVMKHLFMSHMMRAASCASVVSKSNRHSHRPKCCPAQTACAAPIGAAQHSNLWQLDAL